jgi:hypothetical protein
MTAAPASAPARTAPTRRGGLKAAARLLYLELRHSAMPLMLPVAIGLFWITTYRKAMAMPPLWYLRATAMQSGALVAFVCPVAGAAAWMGSREARRHTIDLVAITARPQWSRQLASWAGVTCWALVGYLGCVAVLYGVTARQATWGGPLWWPVAVGAAGVAALAALGFAAGTVVPSRFTPPAAAVAAFFVLALSTELIRGSHSYWQVSPLVTGPWNVGPDPGAGVFYRYLPDLSIAQVMLLTGLTAAALGTVVLSGGSIGGWLRRPAAAVTAAGLLAAGTAVALAGTGTLDVHGMIAIPALHDAAASRPLRYTPACSRTAIPVCVHPAYRGYLTTTAAALGPVLSEIAGLPGAPARVSQVAATYQQGAGNDIRIGLTSPLASGAHGVIRLLLPFQLPGPPMTAADLAGALRADAGVNLIAGVTGDGRHATAAQRAVAAALRMAVGLPQSVPDTSAPVAAAARRFAALPAAARHAWLVHHLAAVRAGRITLTELP